MTFVLDASAAVEVLLRTPVGQQIDQMIADATLLSPELLDVEVLSVLRRETRRGTLAAERAQEAIEDLLVWDLERMPHRELMQIAWSYRDNLSAYDAMYVAAAFLQGATVLTVDGPLARAPLRGVVVQNVMAPLP